MRLAILRAGCALAMAASVGAVETRVVAGADRARILPPAGAVVEPYANEGYRISLGEAGAVVVEVELTPLASDVPFRLPPADEPVEGSVALLARALASGADDRYEVVSRVRAAVEARRGR